MADLHGIDIDLRAVQLSALTLLLRARTLNPLMGMLTMHSFMFISSYEDMRAKLREHIAIQTMAHFGGGLFAVGNPGTLQTAAFVFEKRTTKAECDAQEGVYFRLVREPDADSKRRAFEAALAAHTQTQPHPLLFRYVQKDFDAIPGKPWVYWVSQSIRKLFSQFQPISTLSPICIGMRTGHNDRFLRYWWEVGFQRIGKGFTNAKTAESSGLRWFPYMKGGTPRRWFGNQDYVVRWDRNGLIIKELTKQNYPDLGDRLGWKISNEEFYFKRGITWSDLSTTGFAARLSPGGFIFDVKGSCAFPDDPESVMALLNSSFAQYTLALLNPTVSFQVGDIARLPVPAAISAETRALVLRAIELARMEWKECEMSLDFVLPLQRMAGLAARKDQLTALEKKIDTEVSRQYGLTEEDLAAIDRELSGPAATEDAEVGESEGSSGDDDAEADGDFTPADWARSWISYALGTVLSRFEIGKPGGLGCGDFPPATATAIRALIDPDGIMPCDDGHPQDIAARAVKCLSLMLGDTEAREVIRTATEETGDAVEAVRGWLDRFTGSPDKSFWKYHFQLYRKRPVYWPLQSPRKKYTVWVFHEKFDKNTLFTVRKLVDERLRLLDREIPDKRRAAGNNRSRLKEVDKLIDMADDLREFSKQIKEITDRGYTPHIDDGVLLNAAPLHPLLPSWPDTKTAWGELEAGDYDWAQQAMEYWPARVKAACQTNKSFAIAHGLV